MIDLTVIYQLPNQISVQALLNRLSDDLAPVYLYDQGQHVIGCCAKRLYVAGNHPEEIEYFRRCLDRNGIHYVKERSDLTTAIDHCHIPHEQTPYSGAKPSSQAIATGFRGGWMGFIGYDLAARHQGIAIGDSPAPLMIWGEFDVLLRYEQQHWQLYAPADWPIEWHDVLIAQLQVKTLDAMRFKLSDPLAPSWTYSQYQQAFEQVQRYLHAGDAYQVNLTQRFTSQIQQGQLLDVLDELLTLTQAPFAGYCRYGDFELLSCSPELFIEFQENQQLMTRPIKGTLPRVADPAQDALQRQRLATSDKDMAENLMIVDLLRNDLSVYAKTGSVRVDKLFEIESFAHVHHMVSEISATLPDDAEPLNVLLQAMPGGSITGAPKVRAMQIIDELEVAPRGAYCGSLGYLNHDGTGRFNILIRTLQRYGRQLELWAGGGITVASEVTAEYQESLDKIAAIMAAVNRHA